MPHRCLGLLCVLTVLLAGVSAPAATLRVFEDKAAFLAATGATSATGPLPNLGLVDSDSVMVGSVTFSPAPGGGSLYIGASDVPTADPDWYPLTPGNDIALGFENLRVQTAAPVFALGFEIVEPDATMPLWGGTPVDSTYTVTLFQEDTLVGEFVFSNLPKDVVAFIGVWSDTAFDRVEIVDVTASPSVDDDEYFGQFYTGTLPAPPTTVTAVASTGTTVPGGSGVFTAFPQSPALSATLTAFLGLGSAGAAGVYSWDRAIPPNPIQPIADRTTTIPGGMGMFSGFTEVAASGTLVSFIGTGVAQAGVYVNDVTIPPNPVKVADLTTTIPQGTGSFTGFTSVSTSRGHTAFLGLGSGGQAGIYRASVLTKIIAVDDTLAGKVVTELRLGRFGLDGISLAFGATFADGSEGVFVAQVALYPFTGFFAPVANLPVVNQVQAGKAIPVKFSLGSNQGLAIFAPDYPKSEQIACDSDALVSGIAQTVTAGGSGLSYNATTDQYTYVWKTDKAWAKTCRQLALELQDGSLHWANFTFK